jgi:hypothetical protein
MFKSPVFGPIRNRPVRDQLLYGVLIAAIGSYLLTQAGLVLLGSPILHVVDPIMLVGSISVLSVLGLIGILVKRPFVVGAIVSGVFVAVLVAIFSQGVHISIKMVTAQTLYAVMPACAGWILEQWQREVLKGR